MSEFQDVPPYFLSLEYHDDKECDHAEKSRNGGSDRSENVANYPRNAGKANAAEKVAKLYCGLCGGSCAVYRARALLICLARLMEHVIGSAHHAYVEFVAYLNGGKVAAIGERCRKSSNILRFKIT